MMIRGFGGEEPPTRIGREAGALATAPGKPAVSLERQRCHPRESGDPGICLMVFDPFLDSRFRGNDKQAQDHVDPALLLISLL